MEKQEDLNDRLTQAAAVGDLSGLIQALADGANAKENGSWALALACANGHGECVKILSPACDPKQKSSRALRMAAERGHVECVRLLIEVCDPLARDSLALRWAAARGHADCVALLLPASDPLAVSGDGLDAAGVARASGHVEVAGMIEAFIEAAALSGSTQHAKMNSRVKAAL
jgi:ankyrin repeat protein